MDMDIDTALGRIGGHGIHAGPHPGLDGLEGRVLTMIAERPARTTAMRATVAGAAFALLLGVGSAVYPVREARAVQMAPFGVPSPLAPSTLLLGAR
ncbi:hypothetical protein ASG29_04015 [Sphingomonas sp. Leaf412]|uniref:hypothetical protein n=1 Tax=Sphingomonas sp. Leaf412 TaxID=1736370 RepID=UPI000727D73F|nr:hypothetical protein [Sphingomonas sp. Leaf412]KQT35277.1 hypothetical protein ASG29_04015 [Sphingomonas sp. Leaf412]